MEPIPGGFPADKRHDNAGQIRASQSLLTTIENNPSAILGQLGLGSGSGNSIQFPVPGSCGGNPAFCCDGSGNPIPNCGPLNIDIQSLKLAPVPSGQVNGELDVTVDAQITTVSDLPVTANVGFNVTCGVKIDTSKGSHNGVEIIVPVKFTQDSNSGQTQIGTTSGDVQFNNLDSQDITLDGTGCNIIQAIVGGAIPGLLKSQIQTQIENALNGATCKKCPSGDVAECGQFASSCDTNHVCQTQNNGCYQEVGITGRLPGSSLFATLSPGTTGALDLYEILGGYATSNNNGLALGLKGGMEGGGTPRDRCGPTATEPVTGPIPQSAFFQGNKRPDTNETFDIAIGIHKSQLGQFAYAGYDGGILCITVGTRTSAMISSDTLGLIASSLGNIVDSSAPAAVGLRPQSPPDIVLGKNTFMDNGSGTMTVDDPLLDITFHQMEIDFFTQIDNNQFARFMTVVADVHLPIGLQVTATNQIQPVLGNVSMAFSNVSVKNSEALTDDPATLAASLPQLLGLVLPQLSGSLPAFNVPAIGGLNLSITSITAVPTTVGGNTNDFMAIFANLALPTAKRAPVETTAVVADVQQPARARMKDPKQWRSGEGPAVTLDLGATGAQTPVEYSVRLDHGTWSAWSKSARPTLHPDTFWFSGTHAVEVRAREIGKPETIDPTPATLAVTLGDEAGVKPYVAPFHGTSGGAGCGCQSSGSGAVGMLGIGLIVLLIALPRRAIRRRMARLGGLVWGVALACLPGCSCGASNPCGSMACADGDVIHGGFGKFTSIAGDGDRVLVATYDKLLGDLVVVDVTDPANPKATAVDGLPEGATPTHDPSSYRGGLEDAGPNVGAHTSIAITGTGLAVVGYQDVDNQALKIAIESKGNKWSMYTLDAGGGEEVARQTAMTVDKQGNPVIAYLAVGVDDGMNHKVSELRVAHATSNTPGMGDWTTVTVASGVGTCAGLCESSQACIAEMDGETCTPGTNDCATACTTDQVCQNTMCVAKVPDSTLTDIPTGTGLFASPVVLSDGRIAVVYYDRNARSLMASVETGASSGTYNDAVAIDSVTPGDRGMWSNAVVDASDTIHIAYQEALGDQVMYVTFANGAPGVPEVVDDGERQGDRPHPVGQAAAIYLVNGSPEIAYQDALSADVYVAAKSGPGWSTALLGGGLTLDGFSIAATTGHGGTPYLAWEQITPANKPVNALVVQTH